ncbi:MAG: nitroreductase [Stappia sp.]|uniref:nitroreductase family protein n=1 Tax=Stappia sp. TaxID=1870903 RepID=UPI000C49CADD|nr:nitroreductase [Stappia sp.]MBM22438.1 nitroreductase [Stappia sp.]
MIQASPETMRLLLARRSHPAVTLKAPAPEGDTLEAMLTAASRVPDHGKLAPWRFVLIRGEARERLGEKLVEILERRDGPLSDERKAQELSRFALAPLVITVVSKAGVHPKIPVWEQQLAVGAVCMNLVVAAHASGFAAQWLTQWMAFDDEVSALLGLAETERVAGFIHVGTPSETPAERPRPELSDIVSEWSPQ